MNLTARIMTVLLLTLAVAVAIFYWNEARKEVVFLCANFAPGDPEASVITQLSTAELSSFKQRTVDDQKHIELKSPLDLGYFTCVIEFDSYGNVVSADVL